MISRTLEWHRIVDSKPTADTIDRRTAAITELVTAIGDAENRDVILGSTVGVIVGFDAARPNSASAIDLVYQTIKSKDSTVPQDLSDNGLELRAAAGTALGEILSREPSAEPSEEALLVAATLLSGLNLRIRPKERYLKAMLDELMQLAKSTMHRAEKLKRNRVSPGKKLLAIDDKAVTDPAATILAVIKAAKRLVAEFSEQSALDREELNILWWLFSQNSATFGVPFAELPSGKASVAIGAEVANMSLLPASQNALSFVQRGAQLIRKADTKRSLEKAIDETENTTWALLAGTQTDTLGKEYPVLSPLAWLGSKLTASNVATGWSSEFNAVTGLDASMTLDAYAIAEQVFLERIAQRIYQK